MITQSQLHSIATLANATELTALIANEVLAPNCPTYNGEQMTLDVIANISQSIFQRELNKSEMSC